MELGLEGPVDIKIEGDALVISKPAKRLREGWAAASQAIAARRTPRAATYTEEEADFLRLENDFDDRDWE